MIIKSPEFDNDIQRDVKSLYINSKYPFDIKGSYVVKENGDYVTDIDFTAKVKFTHKLWDIVFSRIHQQKKFTFLRVVCGVKYWYTHPPWKKSADEFVNSLLSISITDVQTWVYKMSSFLTSDVLSEITPIISKMRVSGITVCFLSTIEMILNNNAQIIWLEKDLLRGYIEDGAYRYDLIDVIVHEHPVLELVYQYKGDYCLIDIGMVDNYYTWKKLSKYSTDVIGKFCVRDWYKIAKSLRWKLRPEYRHDYLETMKSVSLEAALYYYHDMIDRLEMHRVVPFGLSYGMRDDLVDRYGVHTENAGDKLKLIQSIRSRLLHEIDWAVFVSEMRLKPHHSTNFVVGLTLAATAECDIGVTDIILNTPVDVLVKCSELALRLKVGLKKLIETFIQLYQSKKEKCFERDHVLNRMYEQYATGKIEALHVQMIEDKGGTETYNYYWQVYDDSLVDKAGSTSLLYDSRSEDFTLKNGNDIEKTQENIITFAFLYNFI